MKGSFLDLHETVGTLRHSNSKSIHRIRSGQVCFTVPEPRQDDFKKNSAGSASRIHFSGPPGTACRSFSIHLEKAWVEMAESRVSERRDEFPIRGFARLESSPWFRSSPSDRFPQSSLTNSWEFCCSLRTESNEPFGTHRMRTATKNSLFPMCYAKKSLKRRNIHLPSSVRVHSVRERALSTIKETRTTEHPGCLPKPLFAIAPNALDFLHSPTLKCIIYCTHHLLETRVVRLAYLPPFHSGEIFSYVPYDTPCTASDLGILSRRNSSALPRKRQSPCRNPDT